MSDVGLPPGFGLTVFSLAWIGICAVGLLICLLTAWLRTRRGPNRFIRDPFTSCAIGALVSAIVAFLTILLVSWSGSLGAFAHWIDRSTITNAWLVAQAALWPLVALVWNRCSRPKTNT